MPSIKFFVFTSNAWWVNYLLHSNTKLPSSITHRPYWNNSHSRMQTLPTQSHLVLTIIFLSTLVTVPLFCSTLPPDVWRRCKRDLCCLKCCKRYSDWRSLKKHMNYFCQIEPLYPCPFCRHRARINTLLKYHIMREHKAELFYWNRWPRLDM